MTLIVLSETELAIIESIRVAGAKSWDLKEFAKIKSRIKDHYRKLQSQQCCYCRKNFHGEFNMVIDVEHILPKSHPKFVKYMYEPFNFSAACKRCNMFIKKNDISFLEDVDETEKTPRSSSNYKFIHPNLDKYFEHLAYDVSMRNDKKLIKYTPMNSSSKGSYTYTYFKLHQLEIDSINENQGVSESPLISPAIEPDLAQQIVGALKEKNESLPNTQQSHSLTFNSYLQHDAPPFPYLEYLPLKNTTLSSILTFSPKIKESQNNPPILNLPSPPDLNDKE